MKFALALALVLAACGSKPRPESPIVDEGPGVPEQCCCKSYPLTSSDGKPVYLAENPMECSSQQGDCVPAVQCRGSEPSAPSAPSAASEPRPATDATDATAPLQPSE